jgi:hypothetical protein
MSTTEAILEKVNALPPDKREEVLEFVDSMVRKTATARPYSFLDVALSQKLEGPKDWAANFEEYLHGDKRNAL